MLYQKLTKDTCSLIGLNEETFSSVKTVVRFGVNAFLMSVLHETND